MIEIREAVEDDEDAICQVTADAFDSSEFGHNGEADLVRTLHHSDIEQLSLVACDEGEIVGHLLFTHATIQSEQGQHVGMGLAPMSVAPDHQRQGIGAALIAHGLERLFVEGAKFVIVLGHPEYYPRFGFRLASELSITHGFDGLPQELFFVAPSPDLPNDSTLAGAAFYAEAFGPQHG